MLKIKCHIRVLFCLLSFNFWYAQELKFTANFFLNENPLTNVQVSVYDMAKDKWIETIYTKNSSQYNIELETGNNYKIVFSHPKTHKMFFEIVSNNMSENDLYNRYNYEIDVDFIPATENVDTAVLSKQPVHRIIFNCQVSPGC
ncbi:MAG: hypothetical protein Fur0023_20330 [Bacteroidia bacterium]